jgi:transposase
MSRTSAPVILTEAERVRLEQWIRAGSTPQQVVMRARVILAAAAGDSDKAIAAALQVRRETAALWRRRVREQGIGCVWEIAPGRGRKPRYAPAKVSEWVEATLQTKPSGATHWSTRGLAHTQGVSKSTIHRVWQDHGLKPN